LPGTTIIQDAHGYAGVVVSTNGNVLLGDNTTVTTTGDRSYGLVINNGASGLIIANALTVTTSGSISHGIWNYGGSGNEIRSNGATVTINGHSSSGLRSSGAGSLVSVDNFTVNTHGYYCLGAAIYNTATMTLRNGAINTAGDLSNGITVGSALVAENVTIVTTGSAASGILVTDNGGGASLNLNSLNIVTKGEASALFDIDGNNGGTAVVAINGGSFVSERSDAIKTTGSNFNVTIDITNSATIASNGKLLNNQSANGDVILNLENARTTGGIEIDAANNGITTINVTAGTRIVGDILNNSTAAGVLNMNLDNSTLTGATLAAATATLRLTLANHSRWTLTAPSRLSTLASDNTATIAIPEAQGDDLTITHGITGQTRLEIAALTPAASALDELRVIADETTAMPADAFALAAPVPNGLYTCALDNRADGAWLVQSAAPSPKGALLAGVPATQQALWTAQNDSLLKRLGDLRLTDSTHSALRNPHSAFGNLWLRAYAQRLNINAAVTGHAHKLTLYGIDLGADYRLPLADASTLYLGLYTGYAQADTTYRAPATKAEHTTTYGGLYATYLRANGLYLDAVLKVATIENDLRAPQGQTTLTAAYDNLNYGLSVELGQKFPIPGTGWRENAHIEPTLQLSYQHIDAKNYTTTGAPPLTINADDMDALQLRLGYTLGKTLRLSETNILTPYAKFGGAWLGSRGGEIRHAAQSLRPNIDGLRAEFGLGTVWQLSASHQLHFDYEASYAEKYTKPWALTAGYRWQF
jgi:outer membrane autotransporter protein